ncbi:acyltransferase family protein [Microbacterium radiodurans]|uniref:acyltransferase family protein n=1 Tax=Microbacterium radiodurans TaxID=661398 RepID=UPI00168B0C1A|nr:acyltransferase family protein [Microbacterium radiodurans]
MTDAAGKVLTRRRRAAAAPTVRRDDIDGLRAFAILLVVVYHVWLGRVSGGVDVFLMVSAYFLTASFVRRSAGLRPADLPVVWARRFARLLPAAGLTIASVLAFTMIALPGSQWRDVWGQAWASLFYVQNRQLTANAVDYYARTETFPSPLQHFWSLSVQGQVFVLWPILILGAVIVARAINRSPRAVLVAGFGTLFVVSLAYSVYLTAADQQVAYFSTPARLWEFALGSLAALVFPAIRVSRFWSTVLGWTGIVALLACGVVLDVGAGFPGFAALWPTLAALAVMVAGQATSPSSSTRFLSSRPLAWIGGIAYALYLVHWPILVAYMTLTDSTSVGFAGGVIVIALSLGAAVLLTRLVERPAGRLMGGLRRNLAICAAAVLLVAVPLGSWQVGENVRAAAGDRSTNPGAAVLMPWLGSHAADDARILPTSTQVGADWVSLDGPCDSGHRPRGHLAAESCVQAGDSDDARTLIVIGDSHAQQWLGTVLPIAREADWNVIAVLKGGCAFAPDEDADADCRQWRDEALEYAEAQPADVVMLMGSKAAVSSNEERLPLGLERPVDAIVASGSRVLLVRDNPRFDFDVYRCFEDAADPHECATPVADALAAQNPAAELSEAEDVYLLDLTPYLCPEELCLPVIGNVAVYIDDNHLTATYARSMAPAALAAFREMPGIPLG